MRKSLAQAFGLGCVALSLSCSSDDAGQGSLVEFFSWWTKPGEVEALDAMLAVHERRHPEAKVINAAARDSASARDRLRTRLEAGEPPDTFQANVGQDLLRWVLYNGADDSETKVEALSAERVLGAAWRDVFPEAVLEAAGFDGAVYAVPVNIHRTNSLFYNKQVFAEHGLEPPATLAELHEVCEALLQDGVVPLAVGGLGTWTISLLVFENLLLAQQGADFYDDYFSGRLSSAADPRMLAVLEEAIALWRFTNQDAREIEWDEAVARVHDGRAAMTVMGDWAKGTLAQLGGVPGSTFGQIPFPGTAGVFVFTADTFPLPKGAPRREDALDLLASFASTEGQNAFNPIKGSIPARIDVDASGYDPLAQAMIADFKTDRLSLALSGLAPAAFTDDVQDSLADMLALGDPEPARLALMNRYDVLVAARR